MLKPPQKRARDRRRPDAAVPMTVLPAPPTGPAGGDLGDAYPDPIVLSLEHVAAGGDLGGTMDAPTVVNLSHATTGPSTYPAGDGSLLTNLPGPATLQSGRDVVLGTFGSIQISTLNNPTTLVACWGSTAGTGVLSVVWETTNLFNITSSNNVADAGALVSWIAF